ncbi:MAG: peptide ABC transporter substrate-binding protein, partial [Armatimonadetes bacterium]|nr:peptide ABC transporter substrate-binding protein [Armatimonadota bacterium]
MKRGWLALFIGVALLALAWPAALEAQTGGKVLRMAIPTDPLMNPIIGTDAAAVPVNRFLYGFLTRPDPDTLEPAPDLATKWEVSSDGLTWTFHLRRDVKWQDGQPFTADDVKFTYDTILDRKNNSPRRSAIADITAVTMVDRYTIRFTLSKPIAPFPSIGAYNVGIVPRHLLEGKDVARAGDFNTRQPLGTGPYRISEAAAGDHYTFVPNQHYFRGKPKLDRVIFKVLPDINTV